MLGATAPLHDAALTPATGAGKLRHPLLERKDDRLQVIYVVDLFDLPNKPARRLELPMGRADAVKAAAALGDAGRQVALDL